MFSFSITIFLELRTPENIITFRMIWIQIYPFSRLWKLTQYIKKDIKNKNQKIDLFTFKVTYA